MKFEGEEVDGFEVILRQFKGDIDLPLTNDETVELVITAKVTGVNHRIDQRNGMLFRCHEMKVYHAEVKK